MTEQELKEQLKRYEWALTETEALVLSHEGHITKLENWQKRALEFLYEMKPIIEEQYKMWKGRRKEDEYGAQLDEINKLIKEAKE